MTTPHDMIDFFHRTVTEVDARMAEENRIGVRIAQRTTRIIRGVLFLLACVAAVVLYLIQDLAQDMRTMTQNMVGMYEHFAEVSQDMNGITASVTQMNVNVRSLPPMKERMVLMSQDMDRMNQNVQSMERDVAAMDHNVAVINGGVSEMAGRFELLTRTTQGMGYNVNQMSQPVTSMDPFGFFGR